MQVVRNGDHGVAMAVHLRDRPELQRLHFPGVRRHGQPRERAWGWVWGAALPSGRPDQPGIRKVSLAPIFILVVSLSLLAQGHSQLSRSFDNGSTALASTQGTT